MSKKSGPPPIVFILLFLLLAGAAYWWFFKREQSQVAEPPPSNPGTTSNPVPNSTSNTSNNSQFTVPSSVPSGTIIRVDGSTSMVTINENLKKAFQNQFPGTTIDIKATGTDKGLQALLGNTVDIAAVSRTLNPQEQNQGLVAIPITTDAIALVVGKGNPFTQQLSSTQVSDIFQGKINNWSLVGGSNSIIRVINRPAVSGTNKSFQEQVLKGANFGTTPNIKTLERDATTPLLQALGNDGIGYATFDQVRNQQTIRVLPIDGLTPDVNAYPYRRNLYYVYKKPANPGVQAFIGYATSPQGQKTLLGE
ncbi:phosphate ABC transporter substrate-binding protein [Calothrix sp. PCC 6303]|uniref:phosphate ABC transporter substrate-binding protein n=1 Tax=Calothrix sp. PCC 6303 TaxID=1170562 RepID=UPI0002A02EAC|nr:phosphate ABC transporter substrate-binding protein [Calothrix sp. PCC 6303]AFZ02923.1 phosphate ABC transporter substrate-binding protein, PhoT family [Calothrix sp. PCC 6303]